MERNEFIQAMMECDDADLTEFTGLSKEELHGHESDGTLGDAVANAYEQMSFAQRKKFETLFKEGKL
jgi:succinate dehydrogenase flavin-adding protein (antitoxin of CptAB toxin-antitoxin module)